MQRVRLLVEEHWSGSWSLSASSLQRGENASLYDLSHTRVYKPVSHFYTQAQLNDRISTGIIDELHLWLLPLLETQDTTAGFPTGFWGCGHMRPTNEDLITVTTLRNPPRSCHGSVGHLWPRRAAALGMERGGWRRR